MAPDKITAFQDTVYASFIEQKKKYPWRTPRSPYRVLVSEFMLQQTQTHRVIPKFNTFIETFPKLEDLANSSQGDVIRLWQGLGYNRRAKFLHQAAKTIRSTFNGTIPNSTEDLLHLPGIGPYTAAAIRAFAFNIPDIVIETNIRTVYLHHFFPKESKVPDNLLLPLIKETLETKNPRRWYGALMDYGTLLKKQHPNPSRKSKHYTSQSTFKGSNRQLRGAIIRALSKKSLNQEQLESSITSENIQIPPHWKNTIRTLLAEGLILKQNNNVYTLA